MVQSYPQPLNLETLWLQVLERLHPPVLQALFQQKAALLAFNGASACIGLPSQPLARLAQKSLQSVVLAFKQVLDQDIHVSIRVAGTSTSSPCIEPSQTTVDITSPEEVLVAAQSLAAFFDGEIISISDEWTF